MLLSGPESKKIFQPAFFCAYFFNHVPWLSECWYSQTWECFKSPDTPTAPFWMSMLCKMDGILPTTGNIPNVPQATSPKGASGDLKHSQVWSHQHSQSHGTLVQCSIALSQMLWPKKYAKKNHRLKWLKSFFPSGPERSIVTATNQPEKTFSLWKVQFYTIGGERHRDVLGKGTSPVIPKSRINEARWNVTHAN